MNIILKIVRLALLLPLTTAVAMQQKRVDHPLAGQIEDCWGSLGRRREEAPLPELIAAVKTGDIRSVEAVLQKEPDLEEQDAWGETALQMAAHLGHTHIVRMLLDNGASLRTRWNELPLHKAVWKNRLQTITLLLEREAHEDRERNLNKGLHIVAQCGKREATELLLEARANIEAKTDLNALTDNWGETPLQLAARNGNTQVLMLLLEKGAAIESKTIRGDTVLHRAVSGGIYPEANARVLLTCRCIISNLVARKCSLKQKKASEKLIVTVLCCLKHAPLQDSIQPLPREIVCKILSADALLLDELWNVRNNLVLKGTINWHRHMLLKIAGLLSSKNNDGKTAHACTLERTPRDQITHLLDPSIESIEANWGDLIGQ